MKKITCNTLFKKFYDTKPVVEMTIMAMASLYLIVKYESMIGFLGLLFSLPIIARNTCCAFALCDGHAIIVPEKVQNVEDDIVRLEYITFRNYSKVGYEKDEVVYLVILRGGHHVMYHANRVELGEEVGNYILDKDETRRFFTSLKYINKH